MNLASSLYECGETTFTLTIMYRRKQININILRFDVNNQLKFKASNYMGKYHKFKS